MHHSPYPNSVSAGPLASYLLLEGTGFANSGVDNTSISSDWPDLQFLFYPLHLATDGGFLFRIILGMSEKASPPLPTTGRSDVTALRIWYF